MYIQRDSNKDTCNVYKFDHLHKVFNSKDINFITQVFPGHPWQRFFRMTSISDCLDKAVPFFSNFGLVSSQGLKTRGITALMCSDWKKVCSD